MKRILVACECSGRVRDEFAAIGWDAWSCDLQPSETPGQHYQGDVRDILGDHWDRLVAHPECTYLTVSNNGPMTNGCDLYTASEALELREQAVDFFMLFANSKVPSWGIENPIGIMSTRYRKPDQIVQPYDFGDDASKRTCLWLNNLPRLVPTRRCPGRMVTDPRNGKVVERWSNQTDAGQNRLGPSPTRKNSEVKPIPESLVRWQCSGAELRVNPQRCGLVMRPVTSSGIFPSHEPTAFHEADGNDRQ